MARKAHIVKFQKKEARITALKANRLAADKNAPRKMAVKPRDKITRLVQRCKLCFRPRAYMGDFGICRCCFRELAEKGQIPGVRKSSW